MEKQFEDIFDDVRERVLHVIKNYVEGAGGSVSLDNQPYHNLVDSEVQLIEPIRLFLEKDELLYEYRFIGTVYQDYLRDLSLNEMYQIANSL
jgi:hypothetical protein